MRKLRKLAQVLQRSAWRRGLRLGVAASVEHTKFIIAHRVATLIDVGANKGQFSLALHGIWPQTQIIAFEPLASPSQRFERLFRGAQKVTLRRIALGAASRHATRHVSAKSDSSSLLPQAELQQMIFPGTGEVGLEDVDVMRLDDAVDFGELASPVLLKIDVQGLELDVLKGAVASLPRIDHVYLEVSFVPLYVGQPLAHEIVAWLAAHGFELAGVYHMEFDRQGRSVQADMHFQRAR